jgi:P2-related tail formation protein
MATPLRGTHLIDLCTPSISYDRQVQAACAAFDVQMFEIEDDTGQIIMIPDIMNIDDSNLVDILAWQFHVDFYESSRPLDFRKQLVQMSIIWHKTKGTVALVENVLDTYWPGGATLSEWFEYMDPLPPNYPTDNPDAEVGTFDASNVDVVNDKITIVAHGMANNTQIRFYQPRGATLPVPLVDGVYYFAVGVTADTFRVARTSGGATIDLITGGSSGSLPPNQVWKRGAGSWHDRYRFRILLNENIIQPEDEQAVLTLVNQYKPVSRWCEGLFRPFVSECDIGVTGMVLRFIYRESEAPPLSETASLTRRNSVSVSLPVKGN